MGFSQPCGELSRNSSQDRADQRSDIISCVRLTSTKRESAWHSTFHRLFEIVIRVWSVTRQVISLSPASPNDDSDCTMKSTDHEIARAYKVLGGADEGDDEDESMDHTNLLSGCWRAMKEARSVRDCADEYADTRISELLSAIFLLPLAQCESKQTIWSREEVDQAGRCFLTWLNEVRHRGTFSKIALAFAKVVDAVRSVEGVTQLREAWLDVRR